MNEVDAINWLVAANVVVWLGLGAYLAFLASRQRGLDLRLKQFEALRENRDE